MGGRNSSSILMRKYLTPTFPSSPKYSTDTLTPEPVHHLPTLFLRNPSRSRKIKS